MKNKWQSVSTLLSSQLVSVEHLCNKGMEMGGHLVSLRTMSGLLLWVIPCLVMVAVSLGTSQASPVTDPKEVQAINEIFRNWKISASMSPVKWNLSDDVCKGLPTDGDIKFYDQDPYNPYIVCDCSYNNNSLCHITRFKAYNMSITGTFPKELQVLRHLDNLQIALNNLTGPLPAFIGVFSEMKYLSLGRNAFSGPVPKELGMLTNLKSLGIDTCSFSGPLPPELGNMSSLEQMYVDSMGVTSEIPSTFANLRNLRIWWTLDTDFVGKLPEFIGNMTTLESLKIRGNNLEGPIPANFANLKRLKLLHISELSKKSSSLSFILNLNSLTSLVLRNCNITGVIPEDVGKLTNLTMLDLSFNNLTGQLPLSIFLLPSLEHLYLGGNNFYGDLPAGISQSLLNIDLSYNNISGSLPLWVAEKEIKVNLVANNFIFDESNRELLGLKCLQKYVPCFLGSPAYYSFAINCGGDDFVASDGTDYEADNQNLSTASYFMKEDFRWAVSSVGAFLDASRPKYTEVSLSDFTNTQDPKLFQTVRLSPSSLRYYGLALENGNYTIKLEFAETAFPDTLSPQNHGRRIFDIYIQGILVEKDFDIKKEAGNKSFTAVIRNYTGLVTKNFLEIHFFWAGKGSTGVPTSGYYGPSISAISVTPNFKPTVSNHLPTKKSKSKAGIVVGVTIAAAFLLVLILGIFIWRWKKRQLAVNENKELDALAVMPNTFSYTELKNATGDFSIDNILGEGGFGSVFKGKLSDGRMVAVKKLSYTTDQGRKQFVTEIAAISSVQHRNLVKLYGCCYEGENRLLVFEYLENNSLDQALFGKKDLKLDWRARFGICMGTARGLAYLHEESRPRIIHRDVKASNVLLDTDLNPKISDFGLAKLYDEKKTHISTRVAGTIGYLAPEYAMRGQLTEKADIFGFGVVVLEILTGRPNTERSSNGQTTYLLDWAWKLHEKNLDLDMMDSRLASFDKDEAARMIKVAFHCTQTNPQLRPPMSRVVAMLVGDMEIDDVIDKPAYLTDWKYDEASSSTGISDMTLPGQGGMTDSSDRSMLAAGPGR